ncbi:MAG: DUF1223 domain-containing protein [Thiohalomonadales bacterium]
MRIYSSITPTSCVLLCALFLVSPSATAIEFTSTEKQSILLELYTSEGCSSCPPADHWLSSLKQDPRLWQQIIPLAFHVDYWNYLGWDDRFSSATYSKRQRNYAERGYAKTVYTPGFFKNGREWRAWFRNRDLDNSNKGRKVGLLQATWEHNELQARFKPLNIPYQSLQLHVALLAMGIQDEVTAGENDGKILRHDFVVLSLKHFSASYHANIPQWKTAYSPSQLLSDNNLFANKSNSLQFALAIWVSRDNDPTPIQAVGGLLP